jgi:hypothetical protein
MGHQIGLGHSSIVTPDTNDATCYMAGGDPRPDKPRQSFNGAMNLALRWYEKRTMYINPLTAQAQLVKLATFVDFNKTTSFQPVLVVIGEKQNQTNQTYVLQYNRAKGFNIDTRSLKNWVTVHVNAGFNATERKGALNIYNPLFTVADYLGSGRDLLIEVCSDVPGNDRRPDVMNISVGLGESLCGPKEVVPSPPPSPRPRRRRTPSPKKATPTQVPTYLRPTESPTESPTARPSSSPVSLSPKSSPGVSPSPPPSASPSTIPGATSRPFPASNPVSYSFLYVLSLLLVSLGAWQVIVFFY